MLEVKQQPGSGPARSVPEAGVSIAEAARRTGVSVHTLRYYERAGLVVTPVGRTVGGRRRYRQLDLDWITVCTRGVSKNSAARGQTVDHVQAD
ncbi:hypothetical protein FHR32_007255 [Streptosporangium album]|uniref:HTH merR-type domain-containing protein n=1 Tax=Streptosporangium album TaxID=47479 RepID=A0A7W7WDY2_9ACTN|nr:MerR family DNA-binding transcriptional regulator [Streptosporangium album]MBB4942855.1 hypothetical protein [Streptosporangium album]